MRSDVFHLETPPDPYPLFTTVDEVRLRFGPQTKIMVAIGGWGDSHGFEKAAETRESREAWTKQVKTMVDRTGCDGIDIDWEYPGYVSDAFSFLGSTLTHALNSVAIVTITERFRIPSESGRSRRMSLCWRVYAWPWGPIRCCPSPHRVASGI